MATSTDVKLPRRQVAVFPTRCALCGAEDSDRRVTLWKWSVPLWVVLTVLALLFSRLKKVRVPCCRECSWKIRMRRLVGIAALLFCIALAVTLAQFLPDEWPGLVRHLALAGIMLGLLLLYFIWHVACPPAVGMQLSRKTTTYEFRNRQYAEEFAAANKAQIDDD
ncbi:MAG: hypothetical protein ACYTAF_03075 [Planctomycetota bacterium]|jgi:hypothetical protein